MSERNVNLEEILEKHRQMFIKNSVKHPDYIMDAMKEACRQTLELAAENAKLQKIREGKQIEEIYPIYDYKEINIDEMGIRTKEDFVITGHGKRLKYEKEYTIVDKQSILNTINQVE